MRNERTAEIYNYVSLMKWLTRMNLESLVGKQVGQSLTRGKWKETLVFPLLSGQAGTKSGS